ncbi:hypothetical protein [Clostridium sp.]|uniref:anti-sigma-I factor RsgI family protein n=1 Tax=Clostridium sp. TaxID=1506 RepID=UPI00284C6B0F|nr:hypothetical protein [Clostridium sp.]MDR3596357.1 hypothetical protein [Clostridium sp.]
MEDKLFEKLDQLDIEDTNLLLNEEIQLSLDTFTRKRIEQAVKKKSGYYPENNTFKDKVNNILGRIIMKRKMALALSGALLLSLGGGGYAYAKTNPVAYVSMDINPSVELGVNTFDQVISAEAYNEDGQKVLEGTKLINADVDKAISTVISNAIADGYVKEDGSSGIEITTSSDKENVANKLDESLKETANKALENNNIQATVETEKVALERRDEARKLGITPGKLNLIQKLQELDPTIKVEDYKSSSVKDIMKKTNELRKANNKDQDSTTGNTQDNTNVDQNSSTDTQEIDKQENQTTPSTNLDSDKSSTIKEEKDNDSSYSKDNNGKKEDDEKDTKDVSEKKNNSSVNSQNNSSKSEHSNNGNSENKGKNK